MRFHCVLEGRMWRRELRGADLGLAVVFLRRWPAARLWVELG